MKQIDILFLQYRSMKTDMHYNIYSASCRSKHIEPYIVSGSPVYDLFYISRNFWSKYGN